MSILVVETSWYSSNVCSHKCINDNKQTKTTHAENAYESQCFIWYVYVQGIPILVWYDEWQRYPSLYVSLCIALCLYHAG